jgi:hypothetical protein
MSEREFEDGAFYWVNEPPPRDPAYSGPGHGWTIGQYRALSDTFVTFTRRNHPSGMITEVGPCLGKKPVCDVEMIEGIEAAVLVPYAYDIGYGETKDGIPAARIRLSGFLVRSKPSEGDEATPDGPTLIHDRDGEPPRPGYMPSKPPEPRS